ncbi:zf-DHHC-domain-containing protein [Sistotremastrum niveocremeum HHB9708]|uniref:Palmitoyltransferase n=2 Tax=Sistotremastraceae TaxID=3402574 RepID=A0A164XKE6_9AGAM|nr:zf-DHHC-domain-containing protein [Sistotremastrum niveocremeum HHB9708]KZT44599.1 zf-DHHC-domain-containing protein [Sistotremastrum suecicum HHB10207 ss-3]
MPLLSFDHEPLRAPPYRALHEADDEDEVTRKRFYHYAPLCLAIFFILMPHPSLLIVLVDAFLTTTFRPLLFIALLLPAYTFTALAFTALIICIGRDPGTPRPLGDDDDDQAKDPEQPFLRSPSHEVPPPERWCKKCWAPKPERAHHCTSCGRCVLRMDHHCPWLAHKCVGFRTYGAFLTFLCTTTLLAIYCAMTSGSILYSYLYNPYIMGEHATFHALFLALAGSIFSLSLASFFIYHLWLTTTNQTTVEQLTPMLLRYIPRSRLPANDATTSPRSPSYMHLPMWEHQMNYQQRRLLRKAHGKIRLYDVGWKANWNQVIGFNSKRSILATLLLGGGQGDGHSWPRSEKAEEQLIRFAEALHKAGDLGH